MKQLNFNHLHYFYTVAKHGSVTRAAEHLNVTPQTVSGQLATFEEYLGAPLFDRIGKRLEPNSMGKITLRYAEDIFDLGSQLSRTLASHDPNHDENFCVGIVDAIPKVMALQMLDTCFDMSNDFVLEVHEGELEDLLADLSINKLDLIISDQPLPTSVNVRATNHLLGESGLTFFAEPRLASSLRDEFPLSLNQTPFLISSRQSGQNQNLTAWFSQNNIKPKVVAEFDDTALLQLFGQKGRGVFCLPGIVEEDVLARMKVEVIGRVDTVSHRCYAIEPERKLKHPGITQVLNTSKSLFSRQTAEKKSPSN